MINPPQKRTKPQRVGRFYQLHAELILFVMGLAVGFLLGKL